MFEYPNVFLFFAFYSFLGWVLETAFAGVKHRKFVNRGFLNGFFCPIYGFGAVLVILSDDLVQTFVHNAKLSVLISIVLAVILVTALEYITGLILERIFHCKWWDYSDHAANLKGYICLKYSLLWGILALVLLRFFHPYVCALVDALPAPIRIYSVPALLAYFAADTVKSVMEAWDLRSAILNHAGLPLAKYHETIIRYKRIFWAFPRLLALNAGVLNRDVRSILNDGLSKIKTDLRNLFLPQ